MLNTGLIQIKDLNKIDENLKKRIIKIFLELQENGYQESLD